MQNAIEWDAAQQISVHASEQKEIDKQKAINEFLESSHELTDANDLMFYQTETGQTVSWLVQNAKNLNPMLTTLLNSGHTLDEFTFVSV